MFVLWIHPALADPEWLILPDLPQKPAVNNPRHQDNQQRCENQANCTASQPFIIDKSQANGSKKPRPTDCYEGENTGECAARAVQEKVASYYPWLSASAIIQAFVGGLAFGAVAWQVRLTRDAIVMDHRPWLKITDVEINEIRRNHDGSPSEVIFGYTLNNLGRSPALRVRPRYRIIVGVEWSSLAAGTKSLENDIRSDKTYKDGIPVWPKNPVRLQRIMVGIPSTLPDEARRVFPSLHICVLYDAPGFKTPRISFEAFRLCSGSAENHGMTTEFVSPGVYILEDQQGPIRWVRFTPVFELAKST